MMIYPWMICVCGQPQHSPKGMNGSCGRQLSCCRYSRNDCRFSSWLSIIIVSFGEIMFFNAKVRRVIVLRMKKDQGLGKTNYHWWTLEASTPYSIMKSKMLSR